MVYFMQDIFSYLASALVFFALLAYAIYKKRSNLQLLLASVFLMSSAALSDMLFRWNPNPNIVVLADGMNVFCYSFIMAIMLHFSVVYFFKNTIPSLPSRFYLALYLPPLVLSAVYILTPFMVTGIIHNPTGFKLNYGGSYWVLIAYGMALAALSLLFILWILLEDRDPEERNQTIFVLFVLILVSYFYSSALIFPFLNNLVNFASPLPMTFGILIMVYCYFVHGYFAIEIP